MAKVFKFQRGSTSVNLLSSSTGIEATSYSPKMGQPLQGMRTPPLTEGMGIKATGTGHNSLAKYTQSLTDMQAWADKAKKNPALHDPVWLHGQLTSETNQRRAAVEEIQGAFTTQLYGMEEENYCTHAALSVKRQPWWESTAQRQFPPATSAAGVSMLYDYTAANSTASIAAHDIVGDVPAREIGRAHV